MKRVLAATVTAGLVAALATPPAVANAAPKATTNIGVHAVSVTPAAGDDFLPNTTGTLAFTIKPATGAKGLTVKKGQKLVWAATLPKGLSATLPATTTRDGWTISFAAKSAADGATVVTRTSLRTGADLPNAGASNGGIKLTVNAGAYVPDTSPLTVTFTPVTGWTSSSPTGSTTVPFDAWQELALAGITTDDRDDTSVRATIRGTATPGASVVIRSTQSSDRYDTVKAGEDGTWTSTRTWSATHTYRLAIEQTDSRGRSDSVTHGPWTPGKE